MYAAVGFITIFLITILIIFKKVSPQTAIAILPIIAGIVVGEWANLGGYITNGIKVVAPNATMFVFSVVFFSVMGDVGVFDVIVNKVLKVIGKDPIKISLGAWLITTISHLDGAGATTFLITIGAMAPIYKKMNMKMMNLALIVGTTAGLMNILPWGGPTLRVMTAFNLTVDELFTPMLPSLALGLLSCGVMAFLMGRKEKEELSDSIKGISLEALRPEDVSPEEAALKRPKLLWFNLLLVVVTIASLLMGFLNNAAIFMVATAIALTVNFPDLKDQRLRFEAHAKNMIGLVSIILSAGVLSGILGGSGMMKEMALALLSIVPPALGSHLALIMGVLGVPMGLFFDAESFYYVLVPTVAEVATSYGVSILSIGRVAMLVTGSFMTPLVGTTFLLTGMTGVELGDYQRKGLWRAMLVSMIIILSAALLGLIQL